TRPGVCVRLWSAAAQRGRVEQTEPEIRRVDLAGAVLQLLSLGETDVLRLPWLAPPPTASAGQAPAPLRRLGPLGDDRVTELGRTLARLPLHPRIGRLLVEGRHCGQPERVALSAALLSERDPFVRTLDSAPEREGQRGKTSSDVLDRVE